MFCLQVTVLFTIVSFNSWGSCDYIRTPLKQRLQHKDIDDYNNVLRSDYVQPLTKTEYKYKSVQTGSVNVPYKEGRSTFVGPDPNQTKSYLAKIDTTTTILSPRRYGKGIPSQSIKKNCVKCPYDRTVIAQKGLDGVLIQQVPNALSCVTHQPYSKTVFDVQTLFGPKLFFVLPQGTHSFIAKIINQKTGKEELKCSLKYKVIVRKCPKYQLKNPKDLHAKCDLDNIWGSKCVFYCKHGGHLSHDSPIICDDDLHWSGEEPVCLSESDILDKMFCDLPVLPRNGKFSCEVNTIESYETEPKTPNGSICRVSCDQYYHMPEYLKDYSVFYCNDGKWNSTMLDFCQRSHKIFN